MRRGCVNSRQMITEPMLAQNIGEQNMAYRNLHWVWERSLVPFPFSFHEATRMTPILKEDANAYI